MHIAQQLNNKTTMSVFTATTHSNHCMSQLYIEHAAVLLIMVYADDKLTQHQLLFAIFLTSMLLLLQLLTLHMNAIIVFFQKSCVWMP